MTIWKSHFRLITYQYVSLILLGLILIFVFQRGFHKNPSKGNIIKLNDLPLLTLDNIQRILVIAPHPDDETLGPGGLIQIALKRGLQVKIVVVTNGDGQELAPTLINKKTDPLPQDFIKMGELRQAESLKALQQLGVPAENVIFLGFPDRGVGPIWADDWNKQCPFTAPYTHASENPYPDTYEARASYCGSNLLGELKTILGDYRPDLLLIPHPADQHPDHGGVSNFARLATALLENEDPSYQPQIWGYVVHYNNYPQPRGKYPKQILLPPKILLSVENNWGRVDLTPEQVQIKYLAIQDYPSQDLLLGGFLFSFARMDELFEVMPMQDLQVIDTISLTTQSETTVTYLDPEAANLQVESLPVRKNMLAGWNVIRLNNNLTFLLQLHRDLLPDIKCIFSFKFPDGHMTTMESIPSGTLMTPPLCTTQIDLAAQGSPVVISFATEIKQGGISLSRTGWHFLLVK